MPFEIPKDISRFSVEGLRQFQAEARSDYDTLIASVSGDNVTDEQIAELKALREFTSNVDTELEARDSRLAAFNLLTAEPVVEAVVPDAAEVPAVVATEVVPDAAAVTAAAGAPAVVVPSLADISANSVTDAGKPSGGLRTASLPNYATIIAAADVPGYATSSELMDMVDVAKAFSARTSGYNALSGGDTRASHGVAVIKRDYPKDLLVFGQDEESDAKAIAFAINEANLPTGSLVAAASLSRKDAVERKQSLTAAIGWCSPSITLYDTCLQVTTDGLANWPEVQAPRGGIRHNTGIDWNGIYGDGTGYFNYSEAQIISGVTKPCLTIDCPTFVDTRLGVTGLCLTGNILQNRAYPEYVATFMRGALAASAHQVNMLQVAAVVTGSTAVDLTASASFVGDGTVVSQLYSAVDLAITDMKYRLRLGMASTIEILLPFWVLAQMRADWIRRNATANPNLADADISAWFAARDAAPQFIYDWQDAFSSSNVGPGSSTAITALPTSLVFLAYPAGTWVKAVTDVITLNSIYDSTKLASNQVTQLFTEQGWAMAKMCPLSRAYTLNICPSGESGAQRVSTNTITC